MGADSSNPSEPRAPLTQIYSIKREEVKPPHHPCFSSCSGPRGLWPSVVPCPLFRTTQMDQVLQTCELPLRLFASLSHKVRSFLLKFATQMLLTQGFTVLEKKSPAGSWAAPKFHCPWAWSRGQYSEFDPQYKRNKTKKMCTYKRIHMLYFLTYKGYFIVVPLICSIVEVSVTRFPPQSEKSYLS